MSTGSRTQALTSHPLTLVATALVGTAALLTLFVLLLDQGQLLSVTMGEVARTANYVHEFTHDARHLLGAPCH
jgi:uncharacterized membrane protein SpoIIM required for sporulation